MKFDFDSLLDRRGMDAEALDLLGRSEGAPLLPKEGFDPIPMWVADMSFPTAPSVLEAVRRRLEHPAFGYFLPRQEYFDAILRWHRQRN